MAEVDFAFQHHAPGMAEKPEFVERDAGRVEGVERLFFYLGLRLSDPDIGAKGEALQALYNDTIEKLRNEATQAEDSQKVPEHLKRLMPDSVTVGEITDPKKFEAYNKRLDKLREEAAQAGKED
jgi:hypothetical protein